jgi:endonuclease/exonuclease/phosphatase family metal-dependent hydrolase
VVVHLGLIRASRVRQIGQLLRYVAREVPDHAPLVVAGDFNDWGSHIGQALGAIGLRAFDGGRHATFPSSMPLVQLDYVYARGLVARQLLVPRGPIWGRMSDHLPLIAEFEMPRPAAPAMRA